MAYFEKKSCTSSILDANCDPIFPKMYLKLTMHFRDTAVSILTKFHDCRTMVSKPNFPPKVKKRNFLGKNSQILVFLDHFMMDHGKKISGAIRQ